MLLSDQLPLLYLPYSVEKGYFTCYRNSEEIILQVTTNIISIATYNTYNTYILIYYLRFMTK